MLKSIAFASVALTTGLFAQDCANLGTAYGTGDDVVVNGSAPIAIGFAFPFAGGTYTDLHPSTNGFFYLSNGGTPAPGGGDGTATSGELASGSPRICALWTDLNIVAANDAAVHVYSSPAECRITWRNAQNYGVAGNIFTVQAVLHPAGDIQFFYETGATNNSTASAAFAAGIVGVCPGGGAVLPASSDLTAGGATTDNTLFEEFLTANTFDAANNSLLLVPNGPGWSWAPIGAGWVDNCATNRTYGVGCGTTNAVGDARYELFTTATPFDLSNTGHSYLWTGNGYVLSDVATPIVPAIGTPTTFTDDNTQQIQLGFTMPTPAGPTSSIWLCSNGWLSFTATTSTDLSESVLDHRNGTAKLAFLWDDLNPATGGTITVDQVGTDCIITFDGVPEYSNTGANTVQVVLSASGNLEVRYGTCSLADCLVGISPGSTAVDGGPVDYSMLSTSPVVIVTGVGPFGSLILTLGAGSRPIIGTGWNLTTSSVDPLSPITITYVGATPLDPGVDLGFLGAPGCNAHLGSILGNLTGVVLAGSSTVTLPIPVNPVFSGVTIDAQSICLTLANPLNLLTSNGLEGMIGF